MNTPDLTDYLTGLEMEHPKEVRHIKRSVPRDYFLTSLVLKLDQQRRFPVVVLDQVEDSDWPIVGNLFADRDRIAGMIGATRESFSRQWLAAESHPIAPVEVSSGPVREVIQTGEEVDLYSLPIARHFSDDAGPYISSGIAAARDPDTGVYNLSYHRLQLKSKNRFGVSLHSRGHLWDYLRRAEEKNQPLEVAIIIGSHPALYLGASGRLGIDDDEYGLAGALMGEPVELLPGLTVDIGVPASAEIVLEGKILPGLREPEGPFGEYTGYSTSRSTENVLEVSALTRREDPLYLDLVPGLSAEHLLLGGVGKEARVIERMREALPTLKAINFPISGTHFHAYLSFKKTAEGQARQALLLLFGLDPYLKLAIAVDDDIDVFNQDEVMWALATRTQAARDIFIVPEVFSNRLDPSSRDGLTDKMGIDSTAPLNWDVIRCRTDPDADRRADSLLENPERKSRN